MCSLCAALGGSRYWTDEAGHAAFVRTGRGLSLREERGRRVALLNAVFARYDLTISDWGGNSYVLSNLSGRAANMYTLGGIWAEADALSSEPCDPLDQGLIKRLEALGAGEPVR